MIFSMSLTVSIKSQMVHNGGEVLMRRAFSIPISLFQRFLIPEDSYQRHTVHLLRDCL